MSFIAMGKHWQEMEGWGTDGERLERSRADGSWQSYRTWDSVTRSPLLVTIGQNKDYNRFKSLQEESVKKAAWRVNTHLEWNAKVCLGDEIILNRHEVTDDTFPFYFNPKHFAEIFSSDDPSMKVIFVQVLLENDQWTTTPESARSSWRFSLFCCSGKPNLHHLTLLNDECDQAITLTG